MTSQERAKELVVRYLEPNGIVLGLDVAKECALIAVDEIIIEMSDYFDRYDCTYTLSKIEYWLQVKQEIEKL
jgi:hypothetical protein